MIKTIRIKTTWTIPRDFKKTLVYLVLFYSILAEFLISMLGFPSMIRYFNDVMVLILFVYCIGRIIPTFRRALSLKVLAMMCLYIFSLVIGLLFNGGKILLVLWASRNVFRFFAYFIACVVFLNKEDVRRILDMLYKLRWLNIVLCLYQYFVLGKSWDFLGGIFGTAIGCNAAMNVYLCLILTYGVCKYLDGREKMRTVLLTILMSLVIAALSELKIFYVEVVGIVGISLFLGHKKGKLLPLLLAITAGIIVGLVLLKMVFPGQYKVLTNLSQILEYDTNQDSAYRLSRFKAFENIDALFFGGNKLLNLFGLGFGNCEYSSFSFLTSSFYRSYGHLNYRWFAHQSIFLESGYVGFVLYVGILVSIIISAFQAWRRNEQNRYLCRFAIIITCLTIICLWYNAAVRTEPGYLAFFAMSVAAVCMKDKSVAKENENMLSERKLIDETVIPH